MRNVRITVKRVARYDDLITEYELPLENACSMKEGMAFVSKGAAKPEGLCETAWETLRPFVLRLANGETKIYGDWMKNERSALISCNDGFRPVSFLLEALEEGV